MRLSYYPYTLRFRFEAGTSRGTMLEKLTWILHLWDEDNPQIVGVGEAPLFRGLSAEDTPEYADKLEELRINTLAGKPTDLSRFSSIRFGYEQALLDLENGGRQIYFPSDFTSGNKALTINGLIWMGNAEIMLQRLQEKLEEGFGCIKIKIGAIDWKSELQLLKFIRKRFGKETVTIRVDANGGFTPQDAPRKLEELAALDVHSIEQPLKKGLLEQTAQLIKNSPLPIALDEELIGIYDKEDKMRLLQTLKPHYVVLKPALCGGFQGASEWIETAKNIGAGWWITSALESNIGLNALAQWTATLPGTEDFPQGLGTGKLYWNNFTSPLELKGEKLMYNPEFEGLR